MENLAPECRKALGVSGNNDSRKRQHSYIKEPLSALGPLTAPSSTTQPSPSLPTLQRQVRDSIFHNRKDEEADGVCEENEGLRRYSSLEKETSNIMRNSNESNHVQRCMQRKVIPGGSAGKRNANLHKIYSVIFR